MGNTVMVIGQPPEKLITVAKERGINLVVVEDQKVSPLTAPKPMIITAPPIVERHFEDYKSGQERRRERRAKKRRGF